MVRDGIGFQASQIAVTVPMSVWFKSTDFFNLDDFLYDQQGMAVQAIVQYSGHLAKYSNEGSVFSEGAY